jgi:hypothetical protein
VNDFFLFMATWRNGRLASLRGWCSQGRAGSNPAVVTKKSQRNIHHLILFLWDSCFKANLK